MKCKLCRIKDADKKNTHYLTDGIIRSCLNLDGVNDREKGFMFDMSTGNPFIGFGFQRETPPELVEKALGREPTEEEIQNAKQNAFSVDNIFCASCEKHFTQIEQDFNNKILNKLRGHNFTGTEELRFEEKVIIRRFFIIQVWRTAVSTDTLPLSEIMLEELREIVFNNDIAEEKVLAIPLTITYLNTIGDDFEYTKNLVGNGIIDGNAVIFFNDFVIQIFESDSNPKFISLYGLNSEDTFQHFVNKDEEVFIIKVIDNASRIKFSSEYFRQEKLSSTTSFFTKVFQKQYLDFYGSEPKNEIIQDFMNGIIFGKDCTEENRYSMERFMDYTNNYFDKKH